VSNLIFYHPKKDILVILEPNIGEYCRNYRVLVKDYDPPKTYFDGGYYAGTLESLLERGWEFIGDYK
jgi:hypothetical protein